MTSCGGAGGKPVAPGGGGAAAGSASSSPDAAGAARTAPVEPPSPAVAIGGCRGGRALSLGPSIDYPPPPGASGALAIGFLNKDAPIDLIVGGSDDAGTGTLGVMLGVGDGTFKPPTPYALLPGGAVRSIALTDFDTDEDLDVVTAGGSATPEIFLNNGDGTFGPPVALPAGPGGGSTASEGRHVVVRVEDIHGDAHPDVVTYAGGGFHIWHDTGHAAFVASALPAVDGLERGAGLALADFNHDNATDIAVAGTDHGAPVIAVLLGKKGGVFAPPLRLATGASGDAVAVVAADFDGDGKLDLAALFATPAGAATIAVALGTGTGTFAAATLLPIANAGDEPAVVATDLDGDAKVDLVATTASGLAVFRSTGKTFAPPVAVPAPSVRSIAAGDLRGDHLNGVIGTRANGHAIVWPASCE